MTILVTGGTGYIGSHTVVLLQQAGHDVVVLDNLANSHEAVLDRIATITGTRPAFARGDIRDAGALEAVFDRHEIEVVIHFAGLKAVERLQPGYGCVACNLGTGRGYSVLDVVRTFARVSGREIPYDIADRRPGDVARCYADVSFGREELGWQAEYGLEDMLRDQWRWVVGGGESKVESGE